MTNSNDNSVFDQNSRKILPEESSHGSLPGAPFRLSPETTMSTVLDALRELVNYELAVVMSLEGRESLKVRAAAGPLANARLGNFSFSLNDRPDIARLLAMGSPHLFAEGENHVDTYDEVLDMPNEHSCLLSPLKVGDETIGMMTLDHRQCGAFSPSILSFIGVISRLIAVALVQNETERQLRSANVKLAEERNRLIGSEANAFRDFIGESPAWQEVIGLVKLVAAAESPVLLLGETGTGKEEAARAIHRLSASSEGPFVAVNCSALPEGLAESELFGHEKGSFTGAAGLRKGRFELANGGTLFLDEIGDLPADIQPKLLRALQEGRFERVGGEKTVAADVRVIAATHVDLGTAVEAGRFREDLFYRISVFPIRLPPLRERGNDVVILAELFAAKLRIRSGWEALTFSPDALDALTARSWQGNVRELKNAVERAAILSRGGIITAGHLAAGDWARYPLRDEIPQEVREPAAPKSKDEAPRPGTIEQESLIVTRTSLKDRVANLERERIIEALKVSGGKIYGDSGAAARLGLKPTTLQSKMKKLGIR